MESADHVEPELRTQLARIESDLLDRVNDLRSKGPGDIRVSRVSEISIVRTLRECREMLDADEVAWLNATLEVVKRAAFGIQVSGFSRLTQEAMVHRPDIDTSDPADKAVRRIGSVFLAVFGIFNVGRLLAKMFPPKEVARSGAPLAAPENLILAAEAWAIASVCEERMSTSVDLLKEPWERATVDR